jgi:hypothetical protein
LKAELKDEVKAELKHELEAESRDELKAEFSDYLNAELRYRLMSNGLQIRLEENYSREQ